MNVFNLHPISSSVIWGKGLLFLSQYIICVAVTIPDRNKSTGKDRNLAVSERLRYIVVEKA